MSGEYQSSNQELAVEETASRALSEAMRETVPVTGAEISVEEALIEARKQVKRLTEAHSMMVTAFNEMLRQRNRAARRALELSREVRNLSRLLEGGK